MRMRAGWRFLDRVQSISCQHWSEQSGFGESLAGGSINCSFTWIWKALRPFILVSRVTKDVKGHGRDLLRSTAPSRAASAAPFWSPQTKLQNSVADRCVWGIKWMIWRVPPF
jgi:hypothetical protein